MQNENLRVEELKTETSKIANALKSIIEFVLEVQMALYIFMVLCIALGLIFIIAMIYAAVRFFIKH